MIEFPLVSREFRSVITRRRELFTLLGSIFAGMGILLQNILQGKLPTTLKPYESHTFATYALLLAIPSLLLALRIGKLHAGLILNGMLFNRLMQEQDFTRKGDPERAARLNWFGVSATMFLLVDLIAAFSVALLALALGARPWVAGLIGLSAYLLWLGLFLHFHRQAVAVARHKIQAENCAPFDRKEWEEHTAFSLEDTNRGMTTWITFGGLMVFNMFTSLMALGQIQGEERDLVSQDVKEYSPVALGLLMVVTCLTGLVAHLRLRLAAGFFVMQLDPSDRPFRPLRLTDSLLGYMLLAGLLTVSWHVLFAKYWGSQPVLLFGSDVAVFVLAVVAEQITIMVADRKVHGR
jgi:hypothetical protein